MTMDNQTGGSLDNKIIYTLLLSSSTEYSQVSSQSEGCIWSIDFEDGTTSSIRIPSSYSGANACDFDSGAYNPNDAMQASIYELLKNLDLDNDGKIDVNFDASQVDFNSVSVSKVPSLWGPSIVEIRVWE
jgi:hypothetical protein